MKKIKLITVFVLICALVFVAFAACSKNEPQNPEQPEVKPNVAVLRGPTGLGALQIMDTPEKYNVTVCAAPTEITGLLTSGTVDIAAMPLNMAANLYNKTDGSVVMLNVNTRGVLYLLERGSTVKSIADLKGKTLYASAQGATAEFLLNFLLEKNKLDPKKDLTIEWITDHAALSARLLAGNAAIALLPEPNVTTVLDRDDSLRVAIDFNDAWSDATNGNKLAMGCIVVRRAFLDENPNVVDRFIEAYTSSVHFVNGNPVQAGELAEKYDILPGAALAQKAIPGSQLVSITGKDMRDVAQSNLQILFDADAKSIGDAMPDNDFYYGVN